MHNHLNRLLNLIENHHPVIQGEGHIRQFAIILRGIWQKFGVTDRVITGVPDRPPTKTRQARQMRGPILFQHRMQVFQRIADFVPSSLTRFSQDDLPVKGIDLKKGARTEKAVSTHAFAADNAFKQKRIFVILQAAVGTDGRQRIADQLPEHGNKIHPFGELPKSREIGCISSHVVESLYNGSPEAIACRSGKWYRVTELRASAGAGSQRFGENLYGPDADRLFEAVQPLLIAGPQFVGYAIKR